MLRFAKYHGTGNDFILVDNRNGAVTLSEEHVASLCHRHFGIGADGLILLETAPDTDFRMVYYNSDGRPSTMCGNGGRCTVAFAKSLGLVNGDTTTFLAVDGPHTATIDEAGHVWLGMKDVDGIEYLDGYAVLDTGSPHFVQWVEAVADRDVCNEGRSIRHWEEFEPDGINVNFVEVGEDGLTVRTYERGVEDETMSCGTGVTAAAIASTGEEEGAFAIPVRTPGGELRVTFVKDTPTSAREVVLTGPAVFVFSGEVNLANLAPIATVANQLVN
jgi:diaminopimelate epimerase